MDQSQGGNPFGRLIEFARPHKTGYIVSVVLAMKSMREDLKAVERLRKTAEQLSRQERDKSHDRGPER